MASFDLRPPPLWGDFDFDFGCLLGGGPPCLLEVGLHLKGKGCIATRREVTTNQSLYTHRLCVSRENLLCIFSLSCRCWKLVNFDSSIITTEHEQSDETFFTTLVGHKEAFIHLQLIFEILVVQNTGD